MHSIVVIAQCFVKMPISSLAVWYIYCCCCNFFPFFVVIIVILFLFSLRFVFISEELYNLFN